ncbi:MAG: histidine kinase [Bacteroidales bacterium]|nr:histidine kinase [Bacteroidales bacterium]
MPTRRLFLSILTFQVFLYILFASLLFSQEYSYRHYTVKDGLVQNQVIIMFQDSHGYLWLGTKGGVSRFDGLKFLNYTVNDGLLSNYNHRIFEDAKGGINFCSLIGTSRLFNENITTILLNDTIQSDRNTIILPRLTKADLCILNHSYFPIYIGQYDSLLIHLFSGMTRKAFGSIIKEDGFNKYWIREYDNKLYCFNNNSYSLFADNFRGRIIKDKSGRIFVYDRNSLYQPDTINNQLNLLHHFQNNETTQLYDFDYNSNSYFGLGQKKILVFDGYEITKYKKKFNYINQILVDREDNVWIATETGFYRKISNVFENFTTKTGSNEYIWSIVEDEKQNIWFASYGDGLHKWDGQNISKITDYQSVYSILQGNYFYTGAILATNHNIYYPVREKGVLQYKGGDFSLVQGLPKGSVLDIYEDSLNQRLLAASTAGLIILEDYITPFLFEKDFIESRKFIKTIAQDKFDRYWLGGEYMLNIFDGKEFIEFPNEQFDYDNGAISIFKDHHENLWLGTTSGLYFFNYKKFKKVAKNMLKSQVVSFVELDTTKLVMGVSEGLAIFDLEGFYQSSEEHIEILDGSKGFLGFDCIRNGILKDSDNNIWVAASDRVVKFYPDRLKQDTVKPKVVIQHIVATGSQPEHTTPIYLGETQDSVFDFPYYLKNIRINFHSIHFYAPEKIIYRYKLEGYDNDWTQPSSERYASYTNLSPGKYTFKVMAQNIDGVWSKNPDLVYFEIIPAFWQTFAFRLSANILTLLLVLSIIYLFWNFRRRRRQRIEETEKQISELQLKTIRSQMDPHFTFNALNSISSVIYKGNKEKAYRYFTKFSKLIRSSLEVSDKISRTLEEEIDFTKNYLDLEKIRFRDQFEYSIDIQDAVNMESVVPKMIIQNYAENAVKHGLKHKEDNRKLKIEISTQDHLLKIIIEDNGVGRKQAEAFNEFSTGKGLQIMNNIYDLYFKLYKIKIEQEIEDIYDDTGNPAGTKVKVSIPLQ